MRTDVQNAIRIIRENSSAPVRLMLAHIFIDYFKQCGIKLGCGLDELHAGRFVDECVLKVSEFDELK